MRSANWASGADDELGRLRVMLAYRQRRDASEGPWVGKRLGHLRHEPTRHGRQHLICPPPGLRRKRCPLTQARRRPGRPSPLLAARTPTALIVTGTDRTRQPSESRSSRHPQTSANVIPLATPQRLPAARALRHRAKLSADDRLGDQGMTRVCEGGRALGHGCSHELAVGDGADGDRCRTTPAMICRAPS
jgi:hypothetical protein